MNINLKYIWLVLIACLLYGCYGPKTLQQELNREVYHPRIVYDLEIIPDKADKYVTFEYSDQSGLIPETNVREINYTWNAAFQFYEELSYDMVIKLGNAASSPKVIDFMEDVVQETFRRSGNFRVRDSITTTDDFRSLITIKKVDARCLYHMSKKEIFGVEKLTDRAEIVKSRIQVNLKLFDGQGQLLIDKDYEEVSGQDYVGEGQTVKSSDDDAVSFLFGTGGREDVKHRAMNALFKHLTDCIQKISIAMTDEINKTITLQ